MKTNNRRQQVKAKCSPAPAFRTMNILKPCVWILSGINFRTLPVLLNNVLKRPEEVFLEAEVGQLSFLQELHGELPQGVHSKDRYIFIGIAAHLQQNATRC